MSVETRVALLEQTSINMGNIVADHEKRMRWVERIALYGVGVIGFASFALSLFEHFKP